MLQIKDICKEYRTGSLVQKALDHVSLNLRDNEFVAILGPSGSGKTTLLNIVGGLDRYDSGDLIINGISTKKYKDRDWDSYRNHTIGFVFQSYNLIPHQTVLANVELALTISGVTSSQRRAMAAEALSRVGLGDHIHKKPNQLSGGQMQRVAIARALVNNPDILLADEPTGALDSDTSLQIMDLLKEVASDRLVVMVTHNPDLARDYATRIVTLKDGRILGDTDPFLVEETGAAPVHKNLGRASMSFLTALTLSFNNLLTKKARTFLVAFAGSIGIIGIALVMALSNGVKGYISNIEEMALSEYPVELDRSTYQSGSFEEMEAADEEEVRDKVRERRMVTMLFSGTTYNDLGAFKTFIDGGSSGIPELSNAIEYDYNITPQIYRIDEPKARARRVCPDETLDRLGFGSFSGGGMLSSLFSAQVFSALPQDYQLFTDQYEVRAGHWPEKENELILVLSESATIPDLTLYALGLKDAGKLDEYINAYLNSEDFVVEEGSSAYDYEDFLGLSFKRINLSDTYSFDDELDVWVSKTDDKAFMYDLAKSGQDLTIVGVVQAKADASAAMLGTGVKYTYDLKLRAMADARDSEIVRAQIADPDRNIFTNTAFGEEENSFSFADLFSVNGDAMADAFEIDPGAFDSGALADAFNVDVSGLDMSRMIDPEAFAAAMPDLPEDELSSLLTDLNIKVDQAQLRTFFEKVLQSYGAYAAADPATDYSKLGDSVRAYMNTEEAREIVRSALGELIRANEENLVTTEQLQAMVNDIAAGFQAYALEAGMTDPEQISEYITAYLQTEQVQALLADDLGQIREQLAKIEVAPEQLQALAGQLSDGYTAYARENGAPDVTKLGESFSAYLKTEEGQKLVTEGIESSVNVDEIRDQLSKALGSIMVSYSTVLGEQLTSGIQAIMSQLGSQIAAGMESAVASMASGFESLFDIDTDAFSDLIRTDLTEQEIRSLMQSLMSGGSSATYKSNLEKLGWADEAEPDAIIIYPKDFDSKAGILEVIETYNEDMKKSGQEDQVISYTDLVGTLMSSVTKIVDAVSYVIIGFVAISLVVSSIMIGVITYISVLERRKEIGILRAIGASKRNISHVFNAETFIIGLLAGLIGILISELTCIPINMIIAAVTESGDIRAFLPVSSAVSLILLSIILTCISGLFPAGKAAKSDPVTALRTD